MENIETNKELMNAILGITEIQLQSENLGQTTNPNPPSILEFRVRISCEECDQ